MVTNLPLSHIPLFPCKGGAALLPLPPRRCCRMTSCRHRGAASCCSETRREHETFISVLFLSRRLPLNWFPRTSQKNLHHPKRMVDPKHVFGLMSSHVLIFGLMKFYFRTQRNTPTVKHGGGRFMLWGISAASAASPSQEQIEMEGFRGTCLGFNFRSLCALSIKRIQKSDFMLNI